MLCRVFRKAPNICVNPSTVLFLEVLLLSVETKFYIATRVRLDSDNAPPPHPRGARPFFTTHPRKAVFVSPGSVLREKNGSVRPSPFRAAQSRADHVAVAVAVAVAPRSEPAPAVAAVDRLRPRARTHPSARRRPFRLRVVNPLLSPSPPRQYLPPSIPGHWPEIPSYLRCPSILIQFHPLLWILTVQLHDG